MNPGTGLQPVASLHLAERQDGIFRTLKAFEAFPTWRAQGSTGRQTQGPGAVRGDPRGSAAHARALPRITPALPRITMHGSTPFSTSSARQFCAQNLSLAPPGMRPPHREPSPQGGAPRKRGGPHAHFKPVFHSCVRKGGNGAAAGPYRYTAGLARPGTGTSGF